MKALLYTAPQALNYQEVTEAEAREPDDVMVQIEAVGICGSDMHAYLGHDERRPAPLILGHEASGRAMNGSYEGKRVAINPLVTCGQCAYCLSGRMNICPERQIISMPPRQGAFADYVVLPERNLFVVPDDQPAEIGALVEPVATGLHAVRLAQEASHRPLNELTALVIGAGAVGIAAMLTLASHGCTNFFMADGHKGRRKTAEQTGVGECFDPFADHLPLGQGMADVVIDAVGAAATRKSAMHYVKAGGVIVHVGLLEAMDGFDARRLTLQEITFIGSYTYSMSDYKASLDALYSGKMGALNWYETRALSEGAQAFSDLYDGRVDLAKIILHP